MNRILLICLIIVNAPAFAEGLPVPPIPPDHPPGETAPIPDLDARVPLTPFSRRPSIDVRLYRSTPPDPSLGFAPGSRFQSAEDRKLIQTPGFSISVPLE